MVCKRPTESCQLHHPGTTEVLHLRAAAREPQRMSRDAFLRNLSVTASAQSDLPTTEDSACVMKLIGRGSYSNVFKCEDVESGTSFA
eukprot:841474-Rhodomonas_salina.1